MPRRKIVWTKDNPPETCRGCLSYNPELYGNERPCLKHSRFPDEIGLCRDKRFP